MNHPSTIHQQLELRAYQMWEERGRPWGAPETDWFNAEQELTVPHGTLSKVARQVGAVIGTMVSAVDPHRDPGDGSRQV
jgi:hypothetical protein